MAKIKACFVLTLMFCSLYTVAYAQHTYLTAKYFNPDGSINLALLQTDIEADHSLALELVTALAGEAKDQALNIAVVAALAAPELADEIIAAVAAASGLSEEEVRSAVEGGTTSTTTTSTSTTSSSTTTSTTTTSTTTTTTKETTVSPSS